MTIIQLQEETQYLAPCYPENDVETLHLAPSSSLHCIVNSNKLETGIRTNSAGSPYTLLLRI